MRQDSRPPDMTFTMSGLPSPLVSSFCADPGHVAVLVLHLGRQALFGRNLGARSLEPPQAATETDKEQRLGNAAISVSASGSSCLLGRS